MVQLSGVSDAIRRGLQQKNSEAENNPTVPATQTALEKVFSTPTAFENTIGLTQRQGSGQPEAGQSDLVATALRASEPDISQDSEVAERVESVRFSAERPPASPAIAIEEALTDDNLSDEQKEEFIAQVIELAGGSVVGNGALDENAQSSLRFVLEGIGEGRNELVDANMVKEAIRDGLSSGRLDADDVYNVVSPDINVNTIGTRELLSGITDPVVLNDVSMRLISDAKREGYDVLNGESGVYALTAAADIANMAANQTQRGVFYPEAARAIVDEIARADKAGLGSNGLSLVESMLLAETTGSADASEVWRERGAFEVLSQTINNVGFVSGDLQIATDSLFSQLVRVEDHDDAPGDIYDLDSRAEGVNELGEYLTRNVGRLAEIDARKTGTQSSSSGEGFYHELLSDSIENVVLDDRFTGQELFAEELANEIVDLAAVAGDSNASREDQVVAGEILGTIAGSIDAAGQNSINEAGENAQRLRVFTDFLTDKIISVGSKKAGPGGAIVSEGGKAVVNEIWQRIEDSARSEAGREVDEALGDLKTLLADIRDVLGEVDDPDFRGGYDDRWLQYKHPDTPD